MPVFYYILLTVIFIYDIIYIINVQGGVCLGREQHKSKK